MSSRFVSGGTNDQPIERDDEWLKAEHVLEEARREKQERSKQSGGKSLYDALQENKAAKQEAFEESIKLRNQFKSLDEDDIDFLDSVRESERVKDAAVQQETREQLDRFRQQQEAANKPNQPEEGGESTLLAGDQLSPPTNRQWAASGKKRRRGPEKEFLKGVKIRKPSTSEGNAKPLLPKDGTDGTAAAVSTNGSAIIETDITPSSNDAAKETSDPSAAAAAKAGAAPPAALGLSAYDSESD